MIKSAARAASLGGACASSQLDHTLKFFTKSAAAALVANCVCTSSHKYAYLALENNQTLIFVFFCQFWGCRGGRLENGLENPPREFKGVPQR